MIGGTSITRSAALHTVLIGAAVLMLMPFIWMLTTSFTPSAEILTPSLRLWPKTPTVQHYREVVHAAPWLRYFWNTVVVSTASALAILFTSSLAGFIFAKYQFPGRNVLFIIILGTAMIPFESYMIPFYLQIKSLGWINTYQGIAAPLLIMSFGIFFMRQSIMTIPDELLDAARIDGATEFYIYRQVILPLSKPALGALAILAVQNAWAFFIWPLIVTSDRSLFTMELGLAMFQRAFTVDYGRITAGSVITVIPVLIAFLILRRSIIRGVTLAGMKG
ncbi:MAG: carbohydrate ABC transporter permease [Armatimonadota bacterium]